MLGQGFDHGVLKMTLRKVRIGCSVWETSLPQCLQFEKCQDCLKAVIIAKQGISLHQNVGHPGFITSLQTTVKLDDDANPWKLKASTFLL